MGLELVVDEAGEVEGAALLHVHLLPGQDLCARTFKKGLSKVGSSADKYSLITFLNLINYFSIFYAKISPSKVYISPQLPTLL